MLYVRFGATRTMRAAAFCVHARVAPHAAPLPPHHATERCAAPRVAPPRVWWAEASRADPSRRARERLANVSCVHSDPDD